MNKVLVFVHGAGKQGRDYAVDPLAAVTLLLGAEPPCVPVYYGDIGNVGSPAGAESISDAAMPPGAAEPNTVTQFKMAFVQEVQSNFTALRAGGDTVSTTTVPWQSLADLIATEAEQIAGYLFNPEVYRKIQVRMIDGLNSAAQMGDSTVIASHSLGTLVAFDALRAEGEHYHISTFFTLGCSLAKLRRLGVRSAHLGAITYVNVSQWLNFYDTTDLIADPLGPAFPLPGYRLRDVYVNIAAAPLPSHDYFPNSEVLAEIARAMQ
jgi:hypothetical protein